MHYLYCIVAYKDHGGVNSYFSTFFGYARGVYWFIASLANYLYCNGAYRFVLDSPT